MQLRKTKPDAIRRFERATSRLVHSTRRGRTSLASVDPSDRRDERHGEPSHGGRPGLSGRAADRPTALPDGRARGNALPEGDKAHARPPDCRTTHHTKLNELPAGRTRNSESPAARTLRQRGRGGDEGGGGGGEARPPAQRLTPRGGYPPIRSPRNAAPGRPHPRAIGTTSPVPVRGDGACHPPAPRRPGWSDNRLEGVERRQARRCARSPRS